MEEWRDALGWAGFFQVSSLGRVKSLARTYQRNGAPVRVAERILKASLRNGYPFVTLQGGGRRRKEYVHALVCGAFNGSPKPGEEVRHIDGIRTNVAAANLRWGTRLQNMRDKIAHGTSLAGEDSPHAKITDEIALRVLRGEYRTLTELAETVGVSRPTLSSVKIGKSWKHLRTAA